MKIDATGHYLLDTDSPLSGDELDNLLPTRKEFSLKLAEQLKRIPANASVVTAIDGAWGTGKTTVWNALKRELETNSGDFDVLEFNPWRIIDEASLVRNFLDEVGQKVRGLGDTAKQQAELAKLWDYLAAGASGILSMAGSSHFLTQPEPSILLTVLAGIGLTKLRKTAALKTAQSAQNLDIIRGKLKETLKDEVQGNKRILVVIDDMDRLTDDEIFLMIRLVKAVSDLPRLHFLLLFDRHQIEEALSRKCVTLKNSYIAKIVQVEWRLPLISPHEFIREFANALEKVKTYTEFEGKNN